MTGVAAGCQSHGAATGRRDEPTETAPPPSDADDHPSSSHYTRVYREVVPSVASVRIYGAGNQRGQGSAFVYDDRSLVTNAHVVGDGAGEEDPVARRLVCERFEGDRRCLAVDYVSIVRALPIAAGACGSVEPSA
jgi:hypothetical protein